MSRRPSLRPVWRSLSQCATGHSRLRSLRFPLFPTITNAEETSVAKLRYTKEHEWISLDGDTATIGITDHAQEQLGDVVFVELPMVGKPVVKGGGAAVVESVKAASEVYAPVSGEVLAVNTELQSDPSLVNRAAGSSGWFMKVKLEDKSELADLMDKAAYDKFVAET